MIEDTDQSDNHLPQFGDPTASHVKINRRGRAKNIPSPKKLGLAVGPEQKLRPERKEQDDHCANYFSVQRQNKITASQRVDNSAEANLATFDSS